MKGLSVFLTVMLLTGCGSREGATNPVVSKKHDQTTRAVIIERKDARSLVVASEDRDAIAPSGERRLANGAQPKPDSQAAYRAIGTEPFWAVTIKGSTATLERPDKAPERFSISRNDDGRAIRYLADGFSLTVTEGPCSDGMSDAIWSDGVSVAFGEGTLKGCGGKRDDREETDQ